MIFEDFTYESNLGRKWSNKDQFNLERIFFSLKPLIPKK